MAENLEIKVTAETGEAVANLKKTETAVAGVTKETEKLNKKQSTSVEEYKKSTEGLNKFRGAAMETWAVLQLGVMAGNALSAMIDKMSASLAAHDEKMNKAAVETIKFQQAMKLAKQGLIDIGGSQEAFLRRYDEYVAKTRPGIEATKAQTKALEEQARELERLGEAIRKANSGVGFTLISPEDADAQLNSIRALAKGLEDILGKAFKAGGAEERDAWGKANEEAVKKVVEAYEKMGVAVPAHIKAVAAAQGAGAADAKTWADAQVAAYDQVAAAVARSRAEESAARNFSSPETEESLRRIQFEAVGAAAAMGQFGTDLDHVAKEVVKTGGTLSVGAQIWLEVAMATDEATAALYRQIEATRALSEAQKESLDAARGWSDYIIALKEGYESGVTSLGSYIQQLIAFKSQLEQMFAGVSGAAADSLNEMIQLIETLLATAGANGPTSRGGGYAGQFDRDANRGK